MSFHFSTDSWWIATLVIMVLTTIPVKIGAELFRALNKDIKHCALAVILGTVAAVVLAKFIGGFTSAVLIYVVMSLIYWQVLQLSLAWSFIFTLVVILIQFAMMQGLSRLGLLLS